MWVKQLLGLTEDGTDSKILSFNMKQELWTVAFVLALLRTQLDFFHGGTGRDGTPETQGQPSSQINHFATPQPPTLSL